MPEPEDKEEELNKPEPEPKPEVKPEPEPEPEPFAFKSKEEFDEAVATGVKKTLEERDKARQEEKERRLAEKEGKQPDKIFDDDYRATDWNDPARKIVEKAKAEIREDFRREQEETRKRIDAINQTFDNEIVEIRKENPDLPAKGTDEGEKFERELTQIGAKYKLTSMTDAYDVYSKIHEGKPEDKKPSKTQTNLAGKVGKGGGSAPQPKRPYTPKSLDEAEESALKKYEELE